MNLSKIQLQYQEDHLMNLEIAQESLPNQWLVFNKAMEDSLKQVNDIVETKKRKISEMNVVRRIAQEKTAGRRDPWA